MFHDVVYKTLFALYANRHYSDALNRLLRIRHKCSETKLDQLQLSFVHALDVPFTGNEIESLEIRSESFAQLVCIVLSVA